ncbi:putative transporter [Psilocybe cubensis]|uniref:Transporter n=1 Tax=Psilocybe cubensis TaxID=181762 RepID=A0ACB8GGS3_PSICU|nr:putative transporter [Psilocybe cubensis]KAH9474630.1 putative transporter [Psilocybe cubensis]
MDGQALTRKVTILNDPVDLTMATLDSSSSGKSEKGDVDFVNDSVDSAAVKRAILKMDLTLLPILTMFYLLSFLDRANIGNARVAGLQKDLLMTDRQYQIAITITYVPYVLSEIPANLIIRRVGPNILMPTLLTIWGIIVLSQGFVTSFKGLAAARAFLAAIVNMHGVGNKPAWSWIFILEGLFSTLIGILSFFLVPVSPRDSRFLSDEQKRLIIQRLDRNRPFAVPVDTFNIKRILSVLVTPHVLLPSVINFMGGTNLFGLALFLPSIVSQLGYSSNRTQLLSVGPFAVGFVVTVLLSYFSDRYMIRAVPIVGVLLFSVAGYSLSLASTSKHMSYAALYLMVPGVYATIPVISAWFSNNTEPYYRRATSIALGLMFANCGGIMSTWRYPSHEGPRYQKTTIMNLTFSLMMITLTIVNALHLIWLNRQKRLRRTDMLAPYATKEEPDGGIRAWVELGDRHPDFLSHAHRVAGRWREVSVNQRTGFDKYLYLWISPIHAVPYQLLTRCQPAMKDVLLVGFGAVGAICELPYPEAERSGKSYSCCPEQFRNRRQLFKRDIIAKEEGIHFESRKYGNIKGWRPDRLCKSVAEAADRPYSYVLVTTKAIPELVRTSEMLAPLYSNDYRAKFPQPAYVLLQNGLNVEVELYKTLKATLHDDPKIISTALWIGTNLLKPNVVEHNDFDRLSLGVYRHEDRTTTTNTAEEAALLDGIGHILEAGGSTISVVPEIQRVKFKKNFWNVAFSSFATLTRQASLVLQRYTLPAMFRAPPESPSKPYEPYVSPATADLISSYTIPAVKATLNELIVLGRALGFPDTEDGLPSSIAESTFEGTWKLHTRADSTHVPSMLLDAEKGFPIEVEVIVGEVVRMAKERNVDLPNQILRKREEAKPTRNV